MRAAAKSIGGSLMLLLAACGEQDAATSVNNAATNGDVEALPADESAATPSDELANGAAEPQGNTTDVEP
jgi:hypothetical protein